MFALLRGSSGGAFLSDNQFQALDDFCLFRFRLGVVRVYMILKDGEAAALMVLPPLVGGHYKSTVVWHLIKPFEYAREVLHLLVYAADIFSPR